MDIAGMLTVVRDLKQPAVLATIINVQGHAYRKEGAAMLFLADGMRIGSISPGCLESDLQERIANVLESGSYEIADYNMNPEEDVIWGEAIGCGGSIQVLLEPIEGELRRQLLLVLELIELGEEVQFTRQLQEGVITYKVSERREAYRALGIEADGASAAASYQLFAAVISPRPRVILFGAGQDVSDIYALLSQSGFRVVIADWRQSYCNQDRFPGAELVLGTPEQIIPKLRLSVDDYLIVCSHQMRYDREMIQLGQQHLLHYIGVMGSKKRIELLFEGRELSAAIHAPIGLDIGAEGPQEIAISIASELIAVRAARKREVMSKEGVSDASIRHLFGGRTEQKNGAAQAKPASYTTRASRKLGASCSIG